jgi:DMSO/TMAO reductase YedYZ molybdopterin-dependent catalytic subunit
MDAEPTRAHDADDTDDAHGRWRPSHYPRGWRFGSGAWACLLALGGGFALAALAQVPPPLEPLSEAIMQVTPVTLANALLSSLGALASPLALIGAAALCLPLAGLVALAAPGAQSAIQPAETRRAWLLRWALVAALALALVAPLAIFAAYPQEALAAWLVGALFAPALWLIRPWYVRLTQPRPNASSASSASAGPTVSRRAALRRLVDSGVTLASFALLGSFNSWAQLIGDALGHPEALRRLFPYTPPAARATGFPIAGVEPEVTPAASFYVVSKNAADPIIASDDWLLRVTGLVDTPLTLTYGQLLAQRPRIDEYVTLRCVDSLPGSHLMSNALWSGVSLAALLRRAGPRAGADIALIHAPDGYAETLPLTSALDPTALLAYGMNGETLLRRHGGPARLLAPGFFGFKNVKWVTEIELAANAQGYWAERGWTAALVHSVARIDVCRAEAAGAALLAGVAYAGAQGVGAVELQVDAGTWSAPTLAQIDPPLAPMAWAQWRASLPLAPGKHAIAARVIDRAGRIQPPGDGHIFPAGALGYDTIEVTL